MTNCKIFLIGEIEHNKIGTDIRPLRRLQLIHKLAKLDAVSFELDTKIYQPIFDKISSCNGKVDDALPFSRAVAYAVENKIPILATDCLDFPEYRQIVEIEHEIEHKHKPRIKTKQPEGQLVLNKFDRLLNKYYKLLARFDKKRDKYVSKALSDYIQRHSVNNIAHFCGAKHLPKLEAMLGNESGYEIDSRGIELLNRSDNIVNKTPNIVNYSPNYFYPRNVKGLETLIIFPDGCVNSHGALNSSVWVYDSGQHVYDPDILGPDTGCGIAAFKTEPFEFKEAADRLADYLKGKNILGRGNHFVDLCSPLVSNYVTPKDEYNILIHSDGKQGDNSRPQTFEQAREKQKRAEGFREDLGYKLAAILGIKAAIWGNWSHNTVEEVDGKYIYRKGAIKVVPDKLFLLPLSLGRNSLIYAVSGNITEIYNSMPHGTGRKGPLSQLKATEKEVEELRKIVYVPAIIPNSSLKSEHPLCYNDGFKIIEALSQYILPLAEIKILAYVGKI